MNGIMMEILQNKIIHVHVHKKNTIKLQNWRKNTESQNGDKKERKVIRQRRHFIHKTEREEKGIETREKGKRKHSSPLLEYALKKYGPSIENALARGGKEGCGGWWQRSVSERNVVIDVSGIYYHFLGFEMGQICVPHVLSTSLIDFRTIPAMVVEGIMQKPPV